MRLVDSLSGRGRLVVLLLALLAVRGVMLWHGNESIYFDEEMATGMIAKELLDGLRLPFLDYQLADHHSGTLLMALITAPFFQVFGESLLVLKLVPLLLYTGTVAIWFKCCDRVFGRAVASMAALLLVFAPPLLTRYSVIMVGYHAESIFFTAAAVYLMFRMLRDRGAAAGWPLAFGAVCGLGTWFAYIFLPTVATCLLFWGLSDPRFFLKRGFALFLVGVVIGGSPWLYYNATHGWSGFSFLAENSGAIAPIQMLGRTFRFLTVDLYRSFATEDDGQATRAVLYGVYGSVAAGSYAAIAAGWGSGLAATVASTWRRFRQPVSAVSPAPEVWFLLFPLVLAGFYGVSDRVVGHYSYEGFRYLVPLYPVLLVLVARAWHAGYGRGGVTRVVANLGILAAIGAGVLSSATTLARESAGRAAVYSPYSYREFGVQRGARAPLDLAGMETTSRRFYRLGRGWYQGLQLERSARRQVDTVGARSVLLSDGATLDPGLLEAYRTASREGPITTEYALLPPGLDVDANADVFFLRVVGSEIAMRQLQQLGVEAGGAAAIRDVQSLKLPARRQVAVFGGLSAAFRPDEIPYYRFENAVDSMMAWAGLLYAHMPSEAHEGFLEAFGESLGVIVVGSANRRLAILTERIGASFQPTQRGSIYRGLGRVIGWRYGWDPERSRDLIQRLDLPHRAQADSGRIEFLRVLERY